MCLRIGSRPPVWSFRKSRWSLHYGVPGSVGLMPGYPEGTGTLARMPEISRFLGIVIQMYAREHLPPHFHASYGGADAVVGIRPVALLEGRLSPRVLALIVEWGSNTSRS